MTIRKRLALSLLACVLCIVILFMNTAPHHPFKSLSAEDIDSFEITVSDIGGGVVSGEDETGTLAELLRSLTAIRSADEPEDADAVFTVSLRNGNSFEIAVYDGVVSVDGTAFATDPALTDALRAFAKEAR